MGLKFKKKNNKSREVSNWSYSVFPTGCGKIRGKIFKKMLTPTPFPQKLFTFVKQFILEFEEIPRIRGKLETLLIVIDTFFCFFLQLFCFSFAFFSVFFLIMTGKVWVCHPTCSFGSNMLIVFLTFCTETLLFGQHFHLAVKSNGPSAF